MKKSVTRVRMISLLMAIFCLNLACASTPAINASFLRSKSPAQPILTPTAPPLAAKAYILIDINSGKIIAEKNAEQKRPPASLTKMMTLYVISQALKSGQIHLDDKVRISQKAWKTGGSRMFVRQGQHVLVKDLLKGIIVDSGNDACVAMAEYMGGSEASFAKLMNKHAKALGMENSHFTDSTGLPNKNHYTTAKDLAILSRALIQQFPEFYPWYKQKWFKFNGIKQSNRNRLLWRSKFVDGIKTGHTNEAGYCLASSAKKDGMRLVAILLGSSSENARADESQRLLDYGFRFFKTFKLYGAQQSISKVRVWGGVNDYVPVGLEEDFLITIPKGQYKNINVSMETPQTLKAPIQKGQKLGSVKVTLNDKLIAEKPLLAFREDPKGGFFSRTKDNISLSFKKLFNS